MAEVQEPSAKEIARRLAGPRYACLREGCRQRWSRRSVPSPPQTGVVCPACGGLYVKWTNYEEMFR